MINKLIKEVPRATIIAISILFVLLLIRFITGHTIHFNRDLLTNFGYVMLYGFTLYFSNALLFIYLDKVFQAERFTRKRIIIGFVSSFLVSILVIFVLFTIYERWVR